MFLENPSIPFVFRSGGQGVATAVITLSKKNVNQYRKPKCHRGIALRNANSMSSFTT